MKIVALNQDPGIQENALKGAAVHLRAIRKAFTDLGHDVTPLDCADDKEIIRKLDSLYTENTIDLIYERYALGKAAGANFATTYHIPFILEVNAPLAEEATRWRGHQESNECTEADAKLFSSAMAVIAVSEETARYASTRGAMSKNIFVCANGFDENVFYPRDKNRCKKNLKIPEEKIVIGFHGRLRPWHGFNHLVAAAHQLLNKKLPVHVLAVGEGPYLAELEKYLNHRDFTYIPWTPNEQLGEIVGAFDVLPLMYDPDQPCYFSPLKLYEGMACGAVPVVPDTGNLSQIINHQRTGIVYNAGELADALKTICNNKIQRHSLSQAATQEASGHTWRHVARHTLEVAGFGNAQ